jgi:beta-glucosidase
MFSKRRIAVVACLLGGALLGARGRSETQAPATPASGSQALLFRDASQPLEKRVADLIARMTLSEKISQMKDVAPPIDRLGVPAYNWWNECLHGVGRAGTATVFPQAIGLAATWDQQLIHRVATAISDEARAKHHEALRQGSHARYFGLTYWSPNINIFRDPRWGRGQETYGEDPYLTARLGVAFVKGLQGSDPRYLKLVATPKHFAVHSGPEPERHGFDTRVSERDLRDTYLPAFEATLTEGGAFSVMCAYNRVDGQAACASDKLLGGILRKEWRFPGYVVSDCGAIHDIEAGHHLADSPEAASAMAVKSGCDLECGDRYDALEKAVRAGLVTEKDIDLALTRLFTARFRLGMFDPPERVPYAQIPISANASPENRALALEAARASIVLLKNDGVLPLRKDLGSIAVVGPTAHLLPALLGNYNGLPRRAVTPLVGIREKVGPAVRILEAPSDGLTDVELTPIPASALFAGRENRPGLLCEYFANKDFSGTPILSRIDRQIDFFWGDVPAVAQRPREGFAVRISGYLVPPTSGRHWLGFLGSGSTRLYLDGKLLIDSSAARVAVQGPSGSEGRRASMLAEEAELEAGRAYQLTVEHVSGSPRGRMGLLWLPPRTDAGLQNAVAQAQQADVVVACVGLSPVLEGEEQAVTALEGFRGGDRTDIGLPASQEKLLAALHATGKPLVVVLLSGSALALNWADAHASAVLAAWYPGEAGGAALADVLFGDYDPAGRLPVTFYRSVTDLPPFGDYSMRERTYRFFSGAPLYPFGHGLSYTRFAYKDLRISPAKARAGDSVRVSAEVANVGARSGAEVVQLYVTDVKASVPVAIRSLQGFERVHLKPGETRRVTFTLTPRQMALIDDAGRRIVEPGEFRVAVGGKQPGFSGSADTSTTGVVEGRFLVTGKAIVVR